MKETRRKDGDTRRRRRFVRQFFHPTNKAAAEALFRQMADYLTEKDKAKNLMGEYMRTFGFDPQTGQWSRTAQDLTQLGTMGAANRTAINRMALYLRNQGVNPEQIAQIQGNMERQSLLDMAQLAEAQKQHAHQTMLGMMMGLTGTGFQAPPSPPKPQTNWAETLISTIGNYMMWDEMRKHNRRMEEIMRSYYSGTGGGGIGRPNPSLNPTGNPFGWGI